MDELTRKFLDDLQTRTAASSSVTKVPPISNPSIDGALNEVSAPVEGGSLWDVMGTEQMPDWMQTQEKKSGMLHGVASLAWHAADTALLGIPGYALGEDAPYQWDEMKGLATVGAVIGEAAGFMAPLGLISKGTKAITAGVKSVGKGVGMGSKAIVGKAVKDSLRYAPAGVEKTKLAAGLAKTFGKKEVKEQVAKYAARPELIQEAEILLGKELATSLGEAFPKMAKEDLVKIIGSIKDGLRTNGRHINSIADYVEVALGTALRTADKNKIVKYAAKASELTTNFALYNILTDGIGAMYDKNEFDPIADVGHALLFSLGLPAVEMLPSVAGISAKGGRLPIFSTARKINKTLKKLDGLDYHKMALEPNGKETLNGLLRIISEHSWLKDTVWGTRAKQSMALVERGLLEADVAAAELHKIIGEGSYKKIWGQFRREAGKDLLGSLPRMIAGAMYFNSHTLLDFNMLRNVDPEMLGAHILVGMFFTRHRKPLWDNPYKTIDNFDSKMALMRTMGMDASGIRGLSNYIDANKKAGFANIGILENNEASLIHKLFWNDSTKEQTKSHTGKSGVESLNSPEFEIVRQAYGEAEIYQLAVDAKQDAAWGDLGINKVDLRSLTLEQLTNIKKGLEKIVIDTDTGETLNVDNLTNWSIKLHYSLVNEPYKMYAGALLSTARDLEVEHSTGDKDVDIDNKISMADIEGLDRIAGFEGIKNWQKLVNFLKSKDLMDDIEQESPLLAEEVIKMENVNEINQRMISKLESIREGLIKASYGENKEVFLDPVNPENNGWLMGMGLYKRSQQLNKYFNILDGRDIKDPEVQKARKALMDIFGPDVPVLLVDIKESLRIRREKDSTHPEHITDEAWNKIKQSGKLSDVRDVLAKLIRFWGIQSGSDNKTDIKDITTGKDITYNEALRVIEALGATDVPTLTSDGFYAQMMGHYMRRAYRNSLLGAKELALLQMFQIHGIGVAKKNRDGSILWEIPKQEGLFDQLLEEGKTPAEAGELVRRYDRILSTVRAMEGPNLKIKKFADFEGIIKFGKFIDEAYVVTNQFQEEILSGTQKAMEKGEVGDAILKQVEYVGKFLMDEDTGLPAQISLEDQRIMIALLDELMPKVLDQKWDYVDVEVVGEEMASRQKIKLYDFLKDIHSKLTAETDVLAQLSDYTDAASMFKSLVQGVSARNVRTVKTMESLIFRFSATPGDRVQSRVNRDNLVSSLLKEIETVEKDFPKKNKDIGDLYEVFLDNPDKLGLEKFLVLANAHITSMKQMMTHEQHQLFVQANMDWYDASMQHSNDAPRYGLQWIERQYGEYNPELQGKDMIKNVSILRGELSKAVEPELWDIVQNSGASKDLTPAEYMVDMAQQHLIDHVETALNKKHPDDKPAVEAGLTNFKQVVLPAVIGNILGTEKMRTATLEEGKRGEHLNYSWKMENKGAAWESAKILANPEIGSGKHIYDVKVDMYEHKTEKDEQKVPDFKDIWVVDTLAEARDQLKAIQEGPGKNAGALFHKRIVKVKGTNYWILKHRKGDHKYIYIRGTEPSNIREDPKGRKKGGTYTKQLIDKAIILYKLDKQGVYDGVSIGNVNIINEFHEIINRVNKKGAAGGGHITTRNSLYDSIKDSDNTHEIGVPDKVVKFHTSFTNTFLVDTSNLTDGRINDLHDAWYDDMVHFINRSVKSGKYTKEVGDRAERVLKSLFGNYYNRLEKDATGKITGGIIDAPAEVVQVIRNWHWSRISKSGFVEFLLASDSKSDLSKIASSWFKYFSNAESTGAKMRGSGRLLEMLWEGERGRKGRKKWGALDAETMDSVYDYNQRGHFRALSIGDESVAAAPLTARGIANQILDGQKVRYGKDSEMYGHVEKMATEIANNVMKSLDSSAVNAQTWIGHDAARIMFLHKGRTIYDTSAGVKPSVWKDTDQGTILMKTNFIYDHKIADIMKLLDLDILTTQSASKSWDKEFVALKDSNGLDLKPDSFKSFQEALISSTDYLTRRDKDTDEFILPRSEIRLEDIALGRNEDRHEMVNVSYALTDFMSDLAHNEFIKTYVDYKTRLESELGMLESISSSNADRAASTAALIEELMEEGSIHEDGNQGSMRRMLKVGSDVDSVLMRDAAMRIAFNKVLSMATKPKNKIGGYSILMPFLEGEIPVDHYMEASDGLPGHKVRLIYGGKKLSNSDAKQRIGDWDKLSFIMNFVDPDGEGRDIQILRNKKGEFEFVDNFEVEKGRVFQNEELMDAIVGKADENGIRRWKSGEFKGLLGDSLRKARDDNPSGKEVMPRMDEIHEAINRGEAIPIQMGYKETDGKIRRKKYMVRFNIHSLSLRLPNMKGDVAIHKVQGFYDPSFGNVVGVNVLDLATIHQGDFDVDALTSYLDTPAEMNKSISELAGMNPDAKVYKEGTFPDIDIWGNGFSVDERAGSLRLVDPLSDHVNNFEHSKEMFGSIMNIKSNLGILQRFDGMMGESPIINGVEMLKFGRYDKNNKYNAGFDAWRQRYANVLQSIIDATKEPNFVSVATADDVTRFVLFGRHFKGSEFINAKLADYGEEGFEGFFKIKNGLETFKTKDGRLQEDAIMTYMQSAGMSNKMLTGVYSPTGRRPADFVETMNIYNDYKRFLKDPNKFVFRKLLYKYRKDDAKKGQLIKMFYDKYDYSDKAKLIKDIVGGKWKAKGILNTPDNIIFNRPWEIDNTGIEKAMSQSVGGEILNIIKAKAGIGGKINSIKRSFSREYEEIIDVMEELENVFLFAGGDARVLLREFTENPKIAQGLDTTSWFYDKFSGISPSKVRDYSIMEYVLEAQNSSLRKVLKKNKNIRGREDTVDSAHYRLSLNEAVIDWMGAQKYASISDTMRGAEGKYGNKLGRIGKGKDFGLRPLDLKKIKGKYKVKNNRKNRIYIYSTKTNKKSTGKVGLDLAAVIEPGDFKMIRGGQRYVQVTKPLEITPIKKRQVQDAYALNAVVGRMTSGKIAGMEPRFEDEFVADVNDLKNDFNDIRTGVYEDNKVIGSKKSTSAYVGKNWTEAANKENVRLDEFMQKWHDRLGGGAAEDIAYTIGAYLSKPNPIEALVSLRDKKNNKVVNLPAFKIDKRLVLAVERYLSENNFEIAYERIFKLYGQEYRDRIGDVINPDVHEMYFSDLYSDVTRGDYSERDPLLDYVFGREFLYIPHVLHRVRGPINKLKGTVVKGQALDGSWKRYITATMRDEMRILEFMQNRENYTKKEIDTLCGM